MNPFIPNRNSVPLSSTPLSSGMDVGFAEILQAHNIACVIGQPLLTEAGFCFLRDRLQSETTGKIQANMEPSTRARPGGLLLPRWESNQRRLWLGTTLLKEFRQPALHQTLLLSAFEEIGWATGRIDDPLPWETGEKSADAQRRLCQTIKNLNRSLPPHTLHFRGDGTGQGVRWEYDLRPGRKTRETRARRNDR